MDRMKPNLALTMMKDIDRKYTVGSLTMVSRTVLMQSKGSKIREKQRYRSQCSISGYALPLSWQGKFGREVLSTLHE